MEKKNIETKIALFKGKEIRTAIMENEWWFSVVEIIKVLQKQIEAKDLGMIYK